METLISSYSVLEIITFIIVFALAIKGVVDFLDWAREKVKALYDKKKSKDDNDKTENERIDKLEQSMQKITDCIDTISNKIDLLMESDKDAIKAYITREHHYFCYQKGWIDDYSLDCLERRYTHYVEEKGNSFVEHLMDELRDLPKKAPDTK